MEPVRQDAGYAGYAGCASSRRDLASKSASFSFADPLVPSDGFPGQRINKKSDAEKVPRDPRHPSGFWGTSAACLQNQKSTVFFVLLSFCLINIEFGSNQLGPSGTQNRKCEPLVNGFWRATHKKRARRAVSTILKSSNKSYVKYSEIVHPPGLPFGKSKQTVTQHPS